MAGSTPFGELLVEMGFATAAEVREGYLHQARHGNRIGEALIELGYLTASQLKRALIHAMHHGQPVELKKPRLGEVLVQMSAIDSNRLDAIIALQREDVELAHRPPRPLGELLVEQGACTYEQIYRALDVQQTLAVPVAELPAEPKEPVREARARPTRVLLVDDSAIAKAFVQEGLEALGYDVTGFDDPLVAYAHLESIDKAARPDLVVTDLNMPALDGAELCRRIKALSGGQLPVVILTADDSETALVGLRAGADDYVRKGTSLEELAARIDGIVRRTSATERVKQMFARYTSDAVVDEILRAGDVVLSGEKREVTVLFCDIRNFTSVAESLPPETVMHALNGLLGRFADAVLTCGGTLDKFLGDGLMAVFGAPVSHGDDPRRALTAAQLMLEAARARNAQPGVRVLEVGIGINTGVVIAGSLGSEKRVEYTCIGDAVNVASRLCSLAGPGEILLGEATARALDGGSRFDALPPVQLKGKSQAIPVYRVPA